MIGNININQVEKLECLNDLPKSKNFDEENSLKADTDTKTRNGISFNIRPNIKKKTIFIWKYISIRRSVKTC